MNLSNQRHGNRILSWQAYCLSVVLLGLFVAFPTFATDSIEISGVIHSQGSPAAGVVVSAEPMLKSFRAILQDHSDERIFQSLAHTTTDKKGFFHLVVERKNALTILVRSPKGNGFTYSVYPILESKTEIPVLNLPKVKTIQINVKDHKDRIVPGAYVRLEPSDLNGWNFAHSITTTNADGLASLQVPTKNASISAWHPRLLSTNEHSVQGDKITIQLNKGYRRVIKIKTKNTPMELNESILRVGRWPIGIEDPTVPVVLAVPKDGIDLTLSTRGGYVFSSEISAVATPEEEVFEWGFPPIMTFKGFIVDSRTKNPIRDAATWIKGMPETMRLTNSKGGFLLSSPLAPFEIEVVASGYSGTTLSFSGTKEEALNNRRIITLTANRILEGLVVSEKGQPVEGATIKPIDSAGRWALPEGTSDTQGAFRIGPIGGSSVMVEKEGWAPAFATMKDDNFTITLTAGSNIRGIVREEETSNPILDAEAGIWPLRPDGQRLTFTPIQALKVDETGHFSFTQLPPTHYEIEVRCSGYKSKIIKATISSSDLKKEVLVDPIVLEEGSDGIKL